MWTFRNNKNDLVDMESSQPLLIGDGSLAAIGRNVGIYYIMFNLNQPF